MELFGHYLQIIGIEYDPDTKIIEIAHNHSVSQTASVSGSLAHLINQVPKSFQEKILISLDARYAATIQMRVTVGRGQPQNFIDEADIDNLISQAVRRVFDTQRAWVAEKLNIDALRVMLADVRVREIRLDGHKVINPVGFKAKFVEFQLMLTFLDRIFYGELKKIVPLEKCVLLGEAGSIVANAFSSIMKMPSLYIVNLLPGVTDIFAVKNGQCGYVDQFAWGKMHFLKLLEREYSVDSEISTQLFDLFLAHRISRVLEHRLEKLFSEELHLFIHGLRSLISGKNPVVCINPYYALPVMLEPDGLHKRMPGGWKFYNLSTESTLGNLGFKLKYKQAAIPNNVVNCASFVFEYMAARKEDQLLHHLAKRRIRWIT